MAESGTIRNAIWVFGDQHRAQALSCNGDPNLNTPVLDRLAAEGAHFDRAVCGFPLCCPFRGSLLTGVYPHRCVPGHEFPLPPEMPTIAHAFRAEGFETAYFGKWHLDGFRERDGRAALHTVAPERRGGFDRWLGYENNNSQWDCRVHGGEGDGAFRMRLPGYETDCLTDLFIEYLRELGQAKRAGREQHFFAVLSVQPPHDPYVAPEEDMARHNPERLTLRPNVPAIPRVVARARRELAGACAMVENLDRNVGRIRRVLAEEGLADDTHLVFFSDHGDMHGSQGQFRKTSPWEESIRIPFIIGGLLPRYEGRSGRFPVLLNHVDIAPTTLGLCGIDPPAAMEGTDYSGWRLPERPRAEAPDSAYLQCVVPTGHGDSVDRPWRGLVTADGWKYICLERTPWLMFNLNEDPYEQANLAHNSAFRDRRKRLNERLRGWVADTGDSFPLPEVT